MQIHTDVTYQESELALFWLSHIEDHDWEGVGGEGYRFHFPVRVLFFQTNLISNQPVSFGKIQVSVPRMLFPSAINSQISVSKLPLRDPPDGAFFPAYSEKRNTLTTYVLPFVRPSQKKKIKVAGLYWGIVVKEGNNLKSCGIYLSSITCENVWLKWLGFKGLVVTR